MEEDSSGRLLTGEHCYDQMFVGLHALRSTAELAGKASKASSGHECLQAPSCEVVLSDLAFDIG